MKITTPKTNFGFFGWRAVAEVANDMLVYLAGLGLLQLLQRSPATKAEKTLAKYEKRPKGFERSSIAFNDLHKGIFTKIMSEVLGIDEDDFKGKITPVIETWYHPLGETAEPKFAREKKIVQKHIDSKDIASWAIDKIGFTGEGDLDTENVELLQAVKVFTDRLLADA